MLNSITLQRTQPIVSAYNKRQTFTYIGIGLIAAALIAGGCTLRFHLGANDALYFKLGIATAVSSLIPMMIGFVLARRNRADPTRNMSLNEFIDFVAAFAQDTNEHFKRKGIINGAGELSPDQQKIFRAISRSAHWRNQTITKQLSDTDFETILKETFRKSVLNLKQNNAPYFFLALIHSFPDPWNNREGNFVHDQVVGTLLPQALPENLVKSPSISLVICKYAHTFLKMSLKHVEWRTPEILEILLKMNAGFVDLHAIQLRKVLSPKDLENCIAALNQYVKDKNYDASNRVVIFISHLQGN